MGYDYGFPGALVFLSEKVGLLKKAIGNTVWPCLRSYRETANPHQVHCFPTLISWPRRARVGFDFSTTYGLLGKGFCEVHHLSPLSASDESVTTTFADLAVVCSNCHRILHRSDPMLSIAELAVVVRHGRP